MRAKSSFDEFMRLEIASVQANLRPMVILRGIAVVKTLVDQFVFCVLFVTPLNALFYAWVGNGFSFRRDGGGMTRDRFVRSYVGNIVMNWAITVPTMLAVYLFSMELQITVSGAVCAIWTLLAIFIGREV